MSLTPEQRKEKIKEVVDGIKYDSYSFSYLVILYDIFPSIFPKPENLDALKKYLLRWLCENFANVQNNIESYIAMSSVHNDQMKSFAYTILQACRQKLGLQQKNQPLNPYSNQKNLRNNPSSMNVPHSNMSMPPGYMNYPPYNYMPNYMMGGPNPMMYQPSSHNQQPNYENRESFYHMNPYYMPMPMGYPPHMYGHNPYSNSMMGSSQMNNYKYPYMMGESDGFGKQPQKKTSVEDKEVNHVTHHESKKPEKKSISTSSLQEYEQTYKRYFELHGKKYEDGPFRIIPPSKQKQKTKIQVQDQSSEIQEIPNPAIKGESKKEVPQGIFNEKFKKCPCQGYGDSENFFACEICKEIFHFFCLKKNQISSKICPFCFMREMDPLNSVVVPIQESFIQRIVEEKFSETCNFEPILQLKKNSKNGQEYEIQLRSMRIDDASNELPEYTWPDEGVLLFEDEKIYEFSALQHNSSMKKRKDSSILMNNQLFTLKKNKINSIKISLEIKNLTLSEYNQKKMKNNVTFVFGIYVVKRHSVDELFNKIVEDPINKVNFIQDYFETHKSLDEDELKIQQIKVNLQDPFSWSLIEMPARGFKCNHGQCFDLKTFLGFMNVQKNRNWKCPICSKSCQKFKIDNQQCQILKAFKEKFAQGKENISREVTFHCDGRALFKEDKSAEEEENNQNSSVQIQNNKLLNKASNKQKKDMEDEEEVRKEKEKEKENNEMVAE